MPSMSLLPRLWPVLFPGIFLLPACGKKSSGDHGGGDPGPILAFAEAGLYTPGEDGSTPWVQTEPPADAASLIMMVEGPAQQPDTCIQTSALRVPDGYRIRRQQRGDFSYLCPDCAWRSTAQRGRAIFIFPNDGSTLQQSGAPEIRLGLWDCDLRIPLRPVPSAEERPALRISMAWQPEVPADRWLQLDLLIADGSGAGPRGAAFLNRLEEELNRHFLPARIRPRVTRTVTLENLPLYLPVGVRDRSGFDLVHGSLQEKAPEVRETPVVPVVLGTCLQWEDPVEGTGFDYVGLVPALPGGLRPEQPDHLLIAGRDCGNPQVHLPWTVPTLGRLLAHELGHYLGLYHSVEPDGSTDHLDDTDGTDRMGDVWGDGSFTPSQIRIMRQHPYLRPGGG